MFYKKEDVNEVITCLICSKTYTDPRLLPCGEAACFKCIQDSSNELNEFNCKLCNDKHTPTSKDGFPVNRPLLKLLGVKAERFNKNPRVDELKKKLEEVKTKCDSFKLDLDKGVDQISEHCIQLRNKVDVQVEIVIEKAHQFNESLIGEINKYEEESIQSFKNTKLKRVQDTDKLIADINKFYDEKSEYLDGIKIDDKVVDESLESVSKMIQDLSDENEILTSTKMEFIKSDNELGPNLIGSLVSKTRSYWSSIFDTASDLNLTNSIEYNCSYTGLPDTSCAYSLEEDFETADLNRIINDYGSSMCLFRLEDGDYVAFYIAQNSLLNYRTFDEYGDLISERSGTLIRTMINHLNVVQMDTMFVLSVSLAHNYNYFIVDDQRISCLGSSGSGKHSDFVLIVDEDFRFLCSRPIDYMFTSANKSNIVCVESYQNQHQTDCLLLNTCLVTVNVAPIESILASNDELIMDLKMNDSLLFVLCDTRNLRIFDLPTFGPVKVMVTHANQIQFLSMHRLVCFNSTNQNLRVYDQSSGFKKIASHDFQYRIERGLKLVCDEEDRLSFYNSKVLRFADFSDF
jgi:hypothetical protein